MFQASHLNNSDIDHVLELVYQCLHNLWVEQQLERTNRKFDYQSSDWIVSLIVKISEISQSLNSIEVTCYNWNCLFCIIQCFRNSSSFHYNGSSFENGPKTTLYNMPLRCRIILLGHVGIWKRRLCTHLADCYMRYVWIFLHYI